MFTLTDILFALLITACYLIGGQIEKSVRRYGVPTFAIMYAYIKDRHNDAKVKARYLFLLGLVGILSIGYGEKSIIKKIVKVEWAIRLVYSLLLALMFILAGCPYYYSPIIVGAFQVRAGRLGSISAFGKEYDILIEDICRAGAIFILTLLTIKGG